MKEVTIEARNKKAKMRIFFLESIFFSKKSWSSLLARIELTSRRELLKNQVL